MRKTRVIIVALATVVAVFTVIFLGRRFVHPPTHNLSETVSVTKPDTAMFKNQFLEFQYPTDWSVQKVQFQSQHVMSKARPGYDLYGNGGVMLYNGHSILEHIYISVTHLKASFQFSADAFNAIEKPYLTEPGDTLTDFTANGSPAVRVHLDAYTHGNRFRLGSETVTVFAPGFSYEINTTWSDSLLQKFNLKEPDLTAFNLIVSTIKKNSAEASK